MKEKNEQVPKIKTLYFLSKLIRDEFKRVAKEQGISASRLLEALMYQYCKEHSKSPQFKDEVQKNEIIDTVDAGLTMRAMKKQIMKIIKG